MTVFVDDARNRLGRMLMCHMIADTTEELLTMADAIGVPRRHLQRAGTAHEHLDVCLSKRALAVGLGAREVTSRELVTAIRRRTAPGRRP